MGANAGLPPANRGQRKRRLIHRPISANLGLPESFERVLEQRQMPIRIGSDFQQPQETLCQKRAPDQQDNADLQNQLGIIEPPLENRKWGVHA